MSAAVEAAAKAIDPEPFEEDFAHRKALSRTCNDYRAELVLANDEKRGRQYRARGTAKLTLSAALPHLTEGLAEVIHERIFGYDDYGVANDDERAEMEAHATVIADELKRRIEG